MTVIAAKASGATDIVMTGNLVLYSLLLIIISFELHYIENLFEEMIETPTNYDCFIAWDFLNFSIIDGYLYNLLPKY